MKTIYIYSTNKGVLTDKQAREAQVGGDAFQGVSRAEGNVMIAGGHGGGQLGVALIV